MMAQLKSKCSSWIQIVAFLVLSLGLACSGTDTAEQSGGESPPPSEVEPPSDPPGELDSTAEEPGSDEPESADDNDSPGEGEDSVTDIEKSNPEVIITTTMGTMRIELFAAEAPKTVANFLQYVRDGFYEGTTFHRVVPGFVIQGGGLGPDLTEKPTRPPIQNEANNGIRNLRGSICMARTGDPHSATSQFFINTKDNPALDFRDESVRGWGYAVFGKIVEGLDVVDAVEKVETTRKGSHDNVPISSILIESARVVE